MASRILFLRPRGEVACSHSPLCPPQVQVPDYVDPTRLPSGLYDCSWGHIGMYMGVPMHCHGGGGSWSQRAV
jgi:hypothetical protein